MSARALKVLLAGSQLAALSWTSARAESATAPASTPEATPFALEHRVSLDRFLSIETGSDLVTEIAADLGALEGRLFRPLARRSAAGIVARSARLALVDLPLGWWLGILQHEAFGHGGRAREFGSSASFHLGSPWGGRDSYATFETTGLDASEVLRIYAAGSEANGFSASELERRIVAGSELTPLSLALLVSSRWVESDYVLRSTPDPRRDPLGFHAEWRGGGDVANYLGGLSQTTAGQPGISRSGVSPLVAAEYERLKKQAYWNAIDPGVWLSLWALGKHWITGAERPRLPLPRAGGWRFLPVLSSDWTPHGGEVSLELAAAPATADASFRGARWLSLTARRGGGPAGTFGALGAAIERFAATKSARFGGESEIWLEPDGGLGGGLRIDATFTRGKAAGWFIGAGAKSAGHWPGRPAPPGAFFRIGYSVER